MAHIKLPEGLPGIRGPMAYRPEMTKPLYEFMEVLMRSENDLTTGERELIATYVSAKNDCFFCHHAHGAVAQHLLQCESNVLDTKTSDFLSLDISEKMRALLIIAGSVQQGGKHVSAEQIDAARNAGAKDIEIHDTVLIAAAFCMFNRYVDGLDTWAPREREFYTSRAKERAETGYTNFNPYK